VSPVDALVEHLFRRESGRMVSVLTRLFGAHNLGLAEDVVQEVLAQALGRWPFAGIPRNPAGWLYQAARNRALDVLRREQVARRLGPDIEAQLGAAAAAPFVERLFLDGEIEDDTLRMMFTCCHPALPIESQIALTLKILCGFSAAEIGRALLAQEAAIQKRLARARQKIREDAIPFEVPRGPELEPRLRAVLSVLYLTFNEGYNASFVEQPIRRDVCLEAMRLGHLLTEHPVGRAPAAFALMALMCFHAARFDARVDGDGHLVTLADQDRARWDGALIAVGFRQLERSAEGIELSEFHLEAGIAAVHCQAPTWAATDWAGILRLYDVLLDIKPSPVVALNRAVALAELRGPRAGLAALGAIPDARVLESYHLLPATYGELHLRLGELGEAAAHFERAIALTASRAERDLLRAKLAACRPAAPA
jgi:RNA polymerase sigma-70 factor (ECF subfamily)